MFERVSFLRRVDLVVAPVARQAEVAVIYERAAQLVVGIEKPMGRELRNLLSYRNGRFAHASDPTGKKKGPPAGHYAD